MRNDRRKAGQPRDPYLEQVKKTRMTVCLEEAYRLFPRAKRSLRGLEREIFLRKVVDQDGNNGSCGTFNRWLERYSYPDPRTPAGRNTLATVAERIAERGAECEFPLDNCLEKWATTPLWDCLIEKYSPTMQRELLSRLGPEVHEIIYFHGDRFQFGVTYFLLARLQTLNAFLALLLLTRELQELDRMVEAEVPAHLALAIFPVILENEVVLQPVKSELLKIIRAKYWKSYWTSHAADDLPGLQNRDPNTDIGLTWLWQTAIRTANAVHGIYVLKQSRLHYIERELLCKFSPHS